MSEPRLDPPEVIACDWCRTLIDAVDAQAVAGQRVCEDCFHDEYSTRRGEEEE